MNWFNRKFMSKIQLDLGFFEEQLSEEPRVHFELFLTSSFLRNKGSGLGFPAFPVVFPNGERLGRVWDFRVVSAHFRRFKYLNLAPHLEALALFPLHISLSFIHHCHPFVPIPPRIPGGISPCPSCLWNSVASSAQDQ